MNELEQILQMVQSLGADAQEAFVYYLLYRLTVHLTVILLVAGMVIAIYHTIKRCVQACSISHSVAREMKDKGYEVADGYDGSLNGSRMVRIIQDSLSSALEKKPE